MYDKKNFHFLVLGIVCFFTFFIHNKVVYPDIMESRNLITAHEMVEYDNWLVPTMNGVLRLEKPPLPTWLAAGVELISPDNLSLQRAVAGIAATLLVFFLYAFASRLTNNRRYGLVAALVLCTSFNIILMGRTATWDIYCHSFMLGAIYFFYKAFEQEGRQWKNFAMAGVLMGLSFLGKGPVSFYALLLPFLLSYFILYRPSFKKKGFPLLVMVLICLVISCWWPVYLLLYHRDMALFAADKESTAWLSHNVRPWYYYWKFFLESGIWSLFLITALIWPYWKKRVTLKKEYLLTVAWTFSVLILLSLLPEKKTRYLLPILIPAALVVAHLFVYWSHQIRRKGLLNSDKIIFRINAGVITLVGLVLPVAVYVLFYAEDKMGLGRFLFIACLFLLVFWLLLRSIIRIRPYLMLWGVVFLFFIVEIFLMPSVADLFNNVEWKSIHGVRKIEKLSGVPFYYPKGENLRIELVYEAGRRILPWDMQKDSLPVELPFVLVSTRNAEETLPESVLDKVELELIGVYDDNHRPKGSRWYSDIFIKYVTLVKEKER